MTAPSRINGMEREHVERSCASKNRYADQLTAVAMGMHQTERYGDKLYAYRCRICNGWHLTKNGRGKDGNPVTPCNEKIFG